MDLDNYESPMAKLSQFIGDYSQNVEFCSYNEDTVRALWIRRALKSNAAATDQDSLWGSRWPEYNADSDLDAILDDLVRKAGGWPVDWSPHYISGISLLTSEERKMLGEDTIFPLNLILEWITEQTKGSDDLNYDQSQLLLKSYFEAEAVASYVVPPYEEETHYVIQHVAGRTEPRQRCASVWGEIACESCDYILAGEGKVLRVGDKCRRCNTPVIAFEPIG